jgi:hypothetical protein
MEEKMGIRKVYYYRILIEDRNSHADVTENALAIINNIFSTNCTASHNTRSLILDQGEVRNGHTIDRVTLDIIINDNNYLFARVGKTKDINEALIRDIRTNRIDNVVNPQEVAYKKLEIFTYFLLDYANGVLGFIEGQSAPGVHTIQNIVNNYSDMYDMTIENIVSNETVRRLLTPGSVISKINYSFRVPNPEILEGLRLPRRVIDALTDTDVTQARLIIRNDSRKHLTSEQSSISRLIDTIGEIALDGDSGISIVGRTPNSSLQEFSFDMQNYSSTIDIPTTRIEDGNVLALPIEEYAEEAFLRMRAAYNSNRENIINLGNVG